MDQHWVTLLPPPYPNMGGARTPPLERAQPVRVAVRAAVARARLPCLLAAELK